VVDLLAAGPGDPLAHQRPPDAPGEVGEPGHVGRLQLLAVPADQEEPVTAPGHVAGDRADPLDVDGDAPGVPVARHVLDGDLIAACRERDRRTSWDKADNTRLLPHAKRPCPETE